MRRTKWWMALLCGAVLALPCAAQEGGPKTDPPEQAPPETEAAKPPAEQPPPKKKSTFDEVPMHRWGAWTISLGEWSPAQVGLIDEVAVIIPSSGPAYPLNLDPKASYRESVWAAYHLPRGQGSVVIKYDSMSFKNNDDFFSPGSFIYYESQAVPLYRGAFDDGLADGVRASSLNKTREFRLDYQAVAWDTPHTRGTWSAGGRSVDHNENLQIRYLALVPNFPPLIPPVISTSDAARFAPRPDIANSQSDFSGTGAGGSLDVEFKIHPRVSIVSGLSLGLLTGKMSARYKSQSSFYFINDVVPGGGNPDVEAHILTSEELFAFFETGVPAYLDAIEQVNVTTQVALPSEKHSVQTYEAYVGVQANVYRGVKVFATFRELYYNNVGARASVTSQGIAVTSRSVAYEGYLLGVSWRF